METAASQKKFTGSTSEVHGGLFPSGLWEGIQNHKTFPQDGEVRVIRMQNINEPAARSSDKSQVFLKTSGSPGVVLCKNKISE